MTYDEWLASVPREFKEDVLWRMEVYRLSLFAGDLAWQDVSKLIQHRRTLGLAEQLFRSVGSVSANISEGYSRKSGKDQARFYEYSLGSAREARNWYFHGRHVPGVRVASHRFQLFTQIIRLLLVLIPSEQGYQISEEPGSYQSTSVDLLIDPPIVESPSRADISTTKHATRTT